MKNIQRAAPLFIAALLLGNLARAAESTVAVENLTLVGEQITAPMAADAAAYNAHGSYGHGGYSHGGYGHGGYSHGGYGGYSHGGYSGHHGSYSYGGPHAHHSFHSHDHYHSHHFHSHDHYHSHFGFNAAAGNVDLLPEVKVSLK